MAYLITTYVWLRDSELEKYASRIREKREGTVEERSAFMEEMQKLYEPECEYEMYRTHWPSRSADALWLCKVVIGA